MLNNRHYVFIEVLVIYNYIDKLCFYNCEFISKFTIVFGATSETYPSFHLQ
jgi:hypothetical protein